MKAGRGEQGAWAGGRGSTVTWPKCSVPGCSPLLEEVGDLEVGPMLDDYQA